MIKGKNQHVMPHGDGWCVIDEANQNIQQTFDMYEEAVAYARHCAAIYEGDVLIHSTACNGHHLPTVSLPQENVAPDRGHIHLASA